LITLRPHQEQWIADLRTALRTNQAVMAQAPTGFGKTVCSAFMAQATVAKGNGLIFIVHRQELIDQTSKTFRLAGVDHGFVASKRPFDPTAKVKVASVGTLVNRLDKITVPELVVVDEAHHATAETWNKVVQWARGGGARVVGLTATPWRLDGKGFVTFDAMIQGPTTSWLIENKFLSDYRAFAPSTPDMSGVGKSMGDFERRGMEMVMDTPKLVGDAVRHYQKYARGMKALVFCVSIKHSANMAAQFRASGVSALHLDGTTQTDERRRAVQAYADGHIDVLCNVDLFGEGFDLSSLAGKDVPIECVIMCRPTMSLSVYLQQCGRGLRWKEAPAILLDHAGNMEKHGLPDGEREWSLSPRKKKKKGDGGGDEAMKQCPICFFCHTPEPACPNCYHVYETARRSIDEEEGDLAEISVIQARALRKSEEKNARTIEALTELGRERGYRHPQAWAAHKLSARLVASRRFRNQRRYG
jgi:DNA repair protein RadD